MLCLSAGTSVASLPAPDTHNTAPTCPVSDATTVCGPWNLPMDPTNAFASSYGQCVYWAVENRPDIYASRSPTDPRADDWDAWTWVGHALAEGLSVNSTAEVGDIVVWSRAGDGNDTGHVAFVVAVDMYGGIVITETNAYYANQGDTRIVSRPLLQQHRALFIHQPPGTTGTSSGTTGTTTGATTTPPAPKLPMLRVRVSPIELRGRAITLAVRLVPDGTLTAVAVSGRHQVRLRSTRAAASASSVLLMLIGKLAPGRWTLVISYKPAKGYAAPNPSSFDVAVPDGARPRVGVRSASGARRMR